MVGRMQAGMKDFASFFAAARLLIQTGGPVWHFLAIGTGPDRAATMAEAQDLVDAGVLEFPKAGAEVLPYVLNAHVGVLMTNPEHHAEGISNAIMEYMACGLPVVCSEGGGNRELVLDGQTGFIIPPHDAAALASHIARLRDDAAAARSMGLAGRERLGDTFAVESMVTATVNVYAEAMRLSSRKQTSYRSA
jgi:glycosyltransferase involved in cell wall biosynthesis